MNYQILCILLFLLSALTLPYSGHSLTCDSILGDNTEADLELLSAAEAKIIESYTLERLSAQQLKNINLYSAKVTNLIDESLSGRPLNANDRSALNIMIRDGVLHSDLMDAFLVAPAQRTKPETLSEVTSVEQFEVGKVYPLPSENTSTFSISLTQEAFEDLNQNRLPERYKKAFLKAIQKGIVAGKNNIGIKLMKTSEGIFFAEVKLVGKIGGKRIYGLVTGTHITLGFIGPDSTSSSDSVHQRIRAISSTL